jgi:hypothetical protein
MPSRRSLRRAHHNLAGLQPQTASHRRRPRRPHPVDTRTKPAVTAARTAGVPNTLPWDLLSLCYPCAVLGTLMARVRRSNSAAGAPAHTGPFHGCGDGQPVPAHPATSATISRGSYRWPTRWIAWGSAACGHCATRPAAPGRKVAMRRAPDTKAAYEPRAFSTCNPSPQHQTK